MVRRTKNKNVKQIEKKNNILKFLSKKTFIEGSVKNEKITKRLIAENLNILFFF